MTESAIAGKTHDEFGREREEVVLDPFDKSFPHRLDRVDRQHHVTDVGWTADLPADPEASKVQFETRHAPAHEIDREGERGGFVGGSMALADGHDSDGQPPPLRPAQRGRFACLGSGVHTHPGDAHVPRALLVDVSDHRTS